MEKKNLTLLLLTVSALFFSCRKSNHSSSAIPPILVTTPVSDITNTSASSGGSFSTNGTLSISSVGIELDTSAAFPNHFLYTDGSGIGTFTGPLTGLMQNTTYYIRAFATADTLTYYGNVLQFTTTYTLGKYNVSTLAGSGAAGFANGGSTSASFNNPDGVAVDNAGNVYVADSKNFAIRKITPDGTVSTLATIGSNPNDVAVDSAGNVYVAAANSKILKITPSGLVSTFAGNGNAADVDGNGVAASFSSPITLAIDPSGNIYVADVAGFRKITPAGVVTTLPTYFAGKSNYVIAVDKNYNLYESNTFSVVKVDSSGAESFIAGGAKAGTSDGTGAAAGFGNILELKTDLAGNIYAADYTNNKIRMITPAGIVSTLAGTGAAGVLNGNSAIATFNGPIGLAIDNAGNFYVPDENNNLIRKISPL
jgi:hypothetical protein